MRQIKQIGDTPVSISVYSVEQTPTTIHDAGTLEIIFCLKGSVKFSYVYEEFVLEEGEFISVDKDAYFLYDGKDNICVSLYFDLKRFQDKYPQINNILFVCEGCKSEIDYYSAEYLNQLKGMMISLLKYIIEKNDYKFVEEASEKVVDLFMHHFNILCYYANDSEIDKETYERLMSIWNYVWIHMKEKITINDIAEQFNYTEGYMSEFLRKNGIGFRQMLGYIRANESEHLLMKTDKTILEISEECGFSDVKYYYSAFKKWYRYTPKQFRERYGKMKEEKLEDKEIDEIAEIVDRLMVTHYMETFLG